MMFAQLLTFFLFNFILSLTSGNENPGRILACFPDRLRYEEFRVEFLLSLNNLKINRVLRVGDLNPSNTDFDPRLRTAVIVHGHGGSGRSPFMQTLRSELLRWKSMNVIMVNWEQGSSNPLLYHQAAINTEYVAIQIQRLFSHIKKTWNIENWGPLHFIGLSLGAHIVGQAANLLRQRDNITVDRVTGLDPAEPCFETRNALRLKSSDARFVDVIHTDGATTLNGRFGLLEPIGHMDFYVNGGSFQPGCNSRRRKRYLDYFELLQHSLSNGSCHHLRAFTLFVESLKQVKKDKCQFWGYPWILGKKPLKAQSMKCDSNSCVEMGINAEQYNSTARVFYVPTTAYQPYCNVKRILS